MRNKCSIRKRYKIPGLQDNTKINLVVILYKAGGQYVLIILFTKAQNQEGLT